MPSSSSPTDEHFSYSAVGHTPASPRFQPMSSADLYSSPTTRSSRAEGLDGMNVSSPPPHRGNGPSEHDPMLYSSSSPTPLDSYGGGYSPNLGGEFSPSLMGRRDSSMNMSFAESSRAGSRMGLTGFAAGDVDDEEAVDAMRRRNKELSFPPGRSGKGGFWSRQSKARKLLILVLVAALIIAAVAIAVPVATKSKKSDKLAGLNANGGHWNSIPFNDTAQAQSYVPPLNEPWDYSADHINGVNIGGWLVIEPFIVPALFEPFNTGDILNLSATVVDEWTLSVALGTSMAATIENHYATFITEQDFAEIAGAGLNWVRIPVPFWFIEVYEGEPFLANVGWKYFLKGLEWARKYGLRVNLDLHAVPGSVNGYNHGGKYGSINNLAGVMGIANAQRTLNYIRTLTEFISQPEYSNVVPMFSVLNEPLGRVIGIDTLRTFYIEIYEMIRKVHGTGVGNGPFITFHDAFVDIMAQPVAQGGWNGFLTGADRMALDTHPYLCFAAPNNDPLNYQAAKPCSYWASAFNSSTINFGLTVAGEWSLAINDCGKWINNVGNGQRYEGTYYFPATNNAGYASTPANTKFADCAPWDAYDTFSDATKAGFQKVAQGHQDAFRNWFFWTWKTGFSPALGKIANPMWNYQLALQEGYMPANPRAALGACPSLVAENGLTLTPLPAPTLSAWQTGGVGANTIVVPNQLSQWGAFPPASIGSTPVVNLPTYTPTGSVVTLPPQTSVAWPTGIPTASVGNGWAVPSDTAGWNVPVAGCNYPDPWQGVNAPIPNAPCSGNANRIARRAATAAFPRPTPPPRAS